MSDLKKNKGNVTVDGNGINFTYHNKEDGIDFKGGVSLSAIEKAILFIIAKIKQATDKKRK